MNKALHKDFVVDAQAMTLPLMSTQQGIFLADHLSPIEDLYTIAHCLELPKSVDLKLFKQAIAQGVTEAQTITADYSTDPARREYTLRPEAEVRIEEFEFWHLSAEKAQQRLWDWMPTDRQNAKSLKAGAPYYYRQALFIMQDNVYWYQRYHHIMLDGFSIIQLTKRIIELYQQLSSAQSTSPSPFVDLSVVLAERQNYEHSADYEKDQQFWKHYALQFSAPVSLSTQATAAKTTANFIKHQLCLSASIQHRIQQVAQQFKVNMPDLMLALSLHYLKKMTDKSALVVGVPFMRRLGSKALRSLMPTVNVLPVQFQLQTNDSWVTLAQHVKTTLNTIRPHQRYDAEQILRDLKSVDVNERLYGSILNYKAFDQKFSIDDQLIETQHISTGPIDDLEFSFIQQHDQLIVELRADATRYCADELVLHAERIALLLEHCLQQPDSACETFCINAQHELQQLHQAGTGAVVAHPPRYNNILDIFYEQAALYPTRTAIVSGERGQLKSLTFQALAERINQFTRYLQQRGATQNTVVAAAIPRSVDSVVVMLSVLNSGASFLPLDLDYPVDRMQMMCEDAHPLFILTTAEISAKLPPNIAQVLLDDVEVQQHIQAQSTVTPDAATRQFAFQDVAYVIFTSGSTGRPKGVMNTHGSLLNLILSHQHTIYWPALKAVNARFPERTLRAAHTHSFSFDSSWLQVFWMLWGQELHIFDENMRRDAYGLVQEIQQRHIDTLDLPPSFCAQMISNGLFAADAHQPSLILIGGEAAPLALWQQLNAQPNLFAHNLYGPTEYTVDTFRAELKQTQRPVIGNPIGNTQAFVLDRQLQACATGVIGELYISGFGIANGYLGRADLSATRFVANPFQDGQRMYRTGDLVRWNMDGKLEFMGRCDDQIKIRGYRVEIGEVENALSLLENVESVVVIAEPINNSHRLLGYCVVKDIELNVEKSQQLSEQYLATLRQNLPDYMVPSALTVMQQFPRNVSGKVDKKALPRPQIKTQSRAPQSPEQLLICQLAAQILKLERFGIDDDFFMTGGDSISAIMLCTALREQGYLLKPSDVFQLKTVAAMARQLHTLPQNTSLTYSYLEHATASFGTALLTQVEQKYGLNTRVLPLLPLQTGMLFHAQSDHTANYSAFTRLSLSAELNPIQLQQALNLVLKRHPQLSGCFDLNVHSEPVFVYQQQLQQSWPVELINVTSDELEQHIEVVLQSKMQLDQMSGLIRAVLLQTETGQSELVLLVHHLLTDGWSTPIFFNDFIAAYAQVQQQSPQGLEALPYCYADVIYNLTKLDQSAAKQAWQAHLSDASPLILFDQAQHAQVQEHHLSLDAQLSQKLQSKLRQHGITLNVFMQMIWAMTLQSYAARDDLIFGTPVAGRSAPVHGLAEQIGLFLNTIPVRVKLDMYRPIWQQLQQLQQQHSQLLEHDGLGLSSIQQLNGQSNLFDSLLVVENYPDHHYTQQKLGHAQIETLSNRGYSHYPLALLVIPNQSIELLLEQRGVITEPEQLLARIQQSIATAIEQPNILLCHYNILLDHEVEQLLAINNTQVDVPHTTLQYLLRQQAQKTPTQTALIDDDISLNYTELRQQVCHLAQRLQQAGVRAGDIVAVALPRSARLSLAILAIIEAGAAYLPIDLSLPQQRIAYMLHDAAPTAIIVEHRVDGIADVLQTEPLHSLTVIDYSTLAAPEQIQLQHYRTHLISPNSAAYMIYTSGTTGQPKGVLVSHQAIVNRILWMQDQYPLASHDTILQKTPCGFDVSVWEFFWSYLVGARLAIAPVDAHKDPMALFNCIEQHQITTLHFVPSMLAIFDQYLTTLLTPTQRQALPLRRIFCSGEALSSHLAHSVQQHFSCELHNLYGPTEAAVDVSYANAVTLDLNEASVPIGQPVWNTQLYILDQYLRPLPVGAEGELYLAGDQLALGYLNRADLTATRFVANPFAHGERMYRTGDIARWRADGTVQYIGRADDQLKIRGQRIELGEIEQQLKYATALEEVLVHAVVLEHAVAENTVGADATPVLVAYLKADAEFAQTFDETALQQLLAQHLPNYMLPAHYVLLDEFPLSHNGKLNRKALPLPQLQSVIHAQFNLASTDTELRLSHMFQNLLGLNQDIDIDQDFFALGGHSILVMKLAMQIRQSFDRQLMMSQLMSNVTIRRLADLILTPERLNDIYTQQMQAVLQIRSGEGRPVFCFCPGSGSAWQYTVLTRYLDADLPIIGLQSPRPDGLLASSHSMEELIERQLQLIQSIQPHGPYTLVGYSLGGSVAYGVATQLQNIGQQVDFLGLIDTYPAQIHQWAETAELDDDIDDEQLEFFDNIFNDLDQTLQHETQQLKADIDANYADAVRLLKPFKMQAYQGHLDVFVAEKGLLSYIQPQQHWQPLVQSLALHRMKYASHSTILSPEQLQILGPQLNQLIIAQRQLERAQ